MTDVDINALIANAAQKPGDPAQTARTAQIAGWSRETAQALAAAEGLELGGDHWKVIEFLRSRYVSRGPATHARKLSAELNEHFAAEGGGRFLYMLFPGGPVAQGSRLAGVPAPSDARDLSFGSSY